MLVGLCIRIGIGVGKRSVIENIWTRITTNLALLLLSDLNVMGNSVCLWM